MEFEQAVNKEVKKFLSSKKLRTNNSNYVFDFEKVGDTLECTTWGYDHRCFNIPQDRKELIRRKVKLQFNLGRLDCVEIFELRFLLNILKTEADGA